ncbi:hypothetical protein [Rhizobium sp. MHM7A]|uniref:hypothetical protein n=1 Tax=Rhizobium sp. MHM7A TaxID=2583233 RepID=UPI0011065BF7|nr:hypothetical protein [Rhizobium sp. MHM7A]TLX16446.1 hypothetical protein FFR93_03675 [Rhizobium sp. MHM7A]
MTNTHPKIDIEAPAGPDVSVDLEVAQDDVLAIHGTKHRPEPEVELDRDDPLIAALIQWLGLEKVGEMTSQEIEALRQMLSRLPEPVAASSFAWDVITKPNDVRRLAESVDLYRRFNQTAVRLSDAMGNNAEIRQIIKAETTDLGRTLASFIAAKRDNMSRVTILADRVDTVMVKFDPLFGRRDLSIAATIVAVTAGQTLQDSMKHLATGFALPVKLSDETLGEIDKLRRHIVSAADKIRRITGVNAMQYSNAALSGVKRSLGEDASGDFRFAVEGLGGTVESHDDLVVASQAFLSLFQQMSAFDHILAEFSLTPNDVPQLLAHVLMRRHFMTAARYAEIDWSEIADELSISPNAVIEDIEAFAEAVSAPGLTGQLGAVASGKLNRPLDEVVKAARKHIVTQEYWLVAGDQLTAIDEGIRFIDLQEVLRMEPEIDAAREALKAVGANTRSDVDALERHLEWMTRAFALPISDEAVQAVIDTKAEIIPLRLCAAEA